MTQHVRNANRPLLERMRELVPSPDNQTCECAGNYQCACCVIAEAYSKLVEYEAKQQRGTVPHD